MTYASDLSDATAAVAAVTDAATAKTALEKVLIVIANGKTLIDTATTKNTSQDTILADLQLTKYSPATHLKTSNPYEDGTEIAASSPSLDGSALISLPSKTAGWLYADINITTAAALLNATSGEAYSQNLAATGGVVGDTKVWTVDSRTPLPSGLSLSSSGVLSGTHTGVLASPTSGYIITVTDAHGNSASKRFSLAVV